MAVSDMQLSGFEGRVAAVTGAGKGIGRTIADSLVAQGARTAYLDVVDPENPEELEQEPKAMFVHCDVSDEGSVDEAFSTVEGEWGPASILVNNAGIFRITAIEDTGVDEWNQMLSINLTGAFLCSKRVLPGMREAGYGRIVSIGSSAGKTGGSKNMAHYAASKAGVMALAKSIASEYAAYGVTSNALAPALINTDMVAGISDLKDRIPVGRLGEPEDVARAVLFLASEASSFITAEVMDVNGGFLID
jgi:NAD(P)-dependent dehydrogenase (short-subunit alcohol dehydrogenase family)